MLNDQYSNQQKDKKPKKYDLEDRTTEFAKQVIIFSKKVSKNWVTFELIPQLIRSAGSVGANYREANDALSKKDFYHRLKISRKELKESIHWLDLILTSNPEYKDEITKLFIEAYELKNIFSSIIIKQKNNEV